MQNKNQETPQKRNTQVTETGYAIPLDEKFWNNRYQTGSLGWDLGEVSPSIRDFIGTLNNKHVSILIPGCGNTYEAEYMLEQGFKNITVIDIASILVERLKDKYKGNPFIQVVHGDFFEHNQKYDIIIEQTFFCALPPTMRQKYIWKMHQLLNNNGLLAGLLFNRSFEGGPPFGGDKAEYENLFSGAFFKEKMETCTNSVPARKQTELWIQFRKNSNCQLTRYKIINKNSTANMINSTFTFSEEMGIIHANLNTEQSELLITGKPNFSRKQIMEHIFSCTKFHIEEIIE